MKAKNDLTKEEVEELVAYDPDTGIFTWKRHRGTTATIKAGRQAGRIAAHGYRQIFLHGRRYYASRLAWLLTHGRWPDDQLDHRNANRSDDRIDNLRECTQSENMANCRRARSNTTGFKGVTYDASQRGTKKFKAQIKKDGQSYFIGWFEDAKSAAAARAGAAAILHGRFARNE